MGLKVAVVGIGVAYLAQVGIGRDWRIGIDRTEVTGLVTDGVFSLVRNPIFTAAGFAAMVPNIIAVVAAFCLDIAIELQVRYVEEPHLQRLHGQVHDDYAAQVGRFVPVVGHIPAQA